MNVEDPRFKALYERHEYSIDPTHASFVPSKNAKKLLEERQRRAKQQRQHQPRSGQQREPSAGPEASSGACAP